MLIDRLIIQFDKSLRSLMTQQDCPLAKDNVVKPLTATAAAIKQGIAKFRPNQHPKP